MSKAYGTIPTIAGEEIEISASGQVIPEPRNKQGHSCCGLCCDVRRAVIIVDILSLVNLCVNVIAIFAISSIEADDDHVNEVLSAIPASLLASVFIVEIVFLGLAIYGAIKFAANLVLVGFIVYCIGIVASLFPVSLVGIIVNGLFAYPHWFLYQEINSGIMSYSNYYNEEQSCCCV